MSGNDTGVRRMPWQSAADDGHDERKTDDEAQLEDQAKVDSEAHDHMPLEDAAAGADIDAPREGIWEAAADAGVARVSERTGLDLDHTEVEDAVRSLATEEGRAAQLRELGVHMSAHLAERYGVEDAEAERLLEASRELRTPQGRQRVLAENAPGATAEILNYLNGRGGTIAERREAVQKLISSDAVRGGLAKAGRGIFIGGIILIVVLVGVLIGAVALFSAVVAGPEAGAIVDSLTTRPDWAGFGGAASAA